MPFLMPRRQMRGAELTVDSVQLTVMVSLRDNFEIIQRVKKVPNICCHSEPVLIKLRYDCHWQSLPFRFAARSTTSVGIPRLVAKTNGLESKIFENLGDCAPKEIPLGGHGSLAPQRCA